MCKSLQNDVGKVWKLFYNFYNSLIFSTEIKYFSMTVLVYIIKILIFLILNEHLQSSPGTSYSSRTEWVIKPNFTTLKSINFYVLLNDYLSLLDHLVHINY